MRKSASIRAEGAGSGGLFEWLDFDGDDCFRDFHIGLVNGTETERFEFGGCAIWGLRRTVMFFRGQLDKVGSGFSFPDNRTYDLARIEDGFLLEIRVKATNRFEQLHIQKPALTFNDEFLKEYDADKS